MGKGKQTVSSGTHWEALAGYSRAVRVGDRILVSGTTATGPDGLVGAGELGLDLAVGVDVVVLGPEVFRTRTFDGLVFVVEPEDDGAPIRPWEEALGEEGFELVSDDEGVLVYRRS